MPFVAYDLGDWLLFLDNPPPSAGTPVQGLRRLFMESEYLLVCGCERRTHPGPALRGANVGLPGHPPPLTTLCRHRQPCQGLSQLPFLSPLEPRLYTYPAMVKCHLIWDFHLSEHDPEYRRESQKVLWQSQSYCQDQVCAPKPRSQP